MLPLWPALRSSLRPKLISGLSHWWYHNKKQTQVRSSPGRSRDQWSTNFFLWSWATRRSTTSSDTRRRTRWRDSLKRKIRGVKLLNFWQMRGLLIGQQPNCSAYESEASVPPECFSNWVSKALKQSSVCSSAEVDRPEEQNTLGWVRFLPVARHYFFSFFPLVVRS